MKELIQKLDLQSFITSLSEYFARPKPIALEGDERFFVAFLQELESCSLPPLPPTPNLDAQLLHLQKFGLLKLEDIHAFAKIILYFDQLSQASFLPQEGVCRAWLDKIKIPTPLLEISRIFDEEGEIKRGKNTELDLLKDSLAQNKKRISSEFSRLLSQENLSLYCVDKQVHFVDQTECLLLKAGYHHAISGRIIARSQSGFFYLCPQSISELRERQLHLQEQIQNLLFELCKEISQSWHKHLPFLKFINTSFDTLDHLKARSDFAKSKNLQFLFRSNTQDLVLSDYCHPALNNPKPLNISLNRNLLLITGVNAGGKTMLLKSILSSAFLSKYLIPQKLNATKSKIGYFKHIQAIISDPQNSKNDISTFAGRMLEVSKILNADSMLLAIDEIELGTDTDEAASLYQSILEQLLSKNNKIIVTTHHKRLASLMAKHPRTQLYAALYDEKHQRPTFDFLQGSIGKSYAFETALRYGLPPSLIQKAKAHYGEDKEKLNALIEKSTLLELELQEKSQELSKTIEQNQKKNEELQEQIQNNKQELENFKNKLQNKYEEALKALKKEAKSLSEIHKNMNQAHKILQNQNTKPKLGESSFEMGENIKYRNERGVIVGKSGGAYLIECDNGMRIKAHPWQLKHTQTLPKTTKPKTKITAPKNSVGISLDLHGLRADEAIEKAEKFISDCLLAGYDEVLIYHGIGGGVLSRVIKEFLSSHPKVVRFEDAPPQMGGFGAKLIWL